MRALESATRAEAKIDQHLQTCIEGNEAIQASLSKLDGRMWAVLLSVAGMAVLTLVQLVADKVFK